MQETENEVAPFVAEPVTSEQEVGEPVQVAQDEMVEGKVPPVRTEEVKNLDTN